MKKGVLIGIIAAGVLLLGVGGTFGGIYLSKTSKYNKADEILNVYAYDFSKADYEASIQKAKNTFAELESFKESEAKFTECEYCLAGYDLSVKKYDEARAIYNSLNGYKESLDKIKEADYCEADDILSNGDFDDAKARFEALDTFMEANVKVLECDYKKASKLLEDKDFDGAKTLFLSLNDYLNSESQANECDYQKAAEFLEEKDYESAKSLFASLGDYSDSKMQVKECDYRVSVDLYNDNEYAKAKESFEKLADYSNSLDYVGACDFYLTFDLYKNHKIDEAGKIFKELIVNDSVMNIAFNDKMVETENAKYIDLNTLDFEDCDKEIRYSHFDEEDNIYDFNNYPTVEMYYKDGSDEFFMFTIVDVYNEYKSGYGETYNKVGYSYDKNGKQISNF